jgi:cytochrome c-type biogenesis protein CcsB
MFLSWCCTSIHLLLLYTLEEKKTIQTSNLFSGLQKYSVSAPQGPLVVFPLPLENQEPFDNSAVPFSPWEKTKGPLAFGFPRAKGKLAEPYPGLFPTPFGGGEYKELELQNENQRSENQRGNGLKNGKPLEKLVGSILAPCALFLNSFATFSLPKEMQQAGPLVPALQSNWLMMHVTVMIISYAALILGSLLSVAFLIFTSFVRSSHHPEGKTMDATFDYLSYRIIGIGFPFLTIGILSGAVWANEAWGSYWSWDPKETWALLTWLIFAIYLHTRLTKGWQGEKPALIASVGFVVVWICYLGVNLLGEGLHSYGFLSK